MQQAKRRRRRKKRKRKEVVMATKVEVDMSPGNKWLSWRGACPLAGME